MGDCNRNKALLFGLLLSLAFLAACAAPASDLAEGSGRIDPANDLRRVKAWPFFWRGPEFSDDLSLESLVASCQESVDYYGKQPEDRMYRFGRDLYSAQEMKQFLVDFVIFMAKYPDAAQRRSYLKKNANIYRGGSRWGKVLFTGYYEPVLEGSRLPGVLCGVPIFGVPADLITVDLGAFDPRLRGQHLVGRYVDGTLVPYYTRHEIDRMESISGRGYELAWVRDPLEAFFLQIQGSGKILLPDGSVLNLGYAKNNGRPYRPIGRFLVEQKKVEMEDLSAEKIKQYIREHPGEMEQILDYNERYVFFRETTGGPLGSTGAVLTPERSMATDPSFYPPGALAYIETRVPGPVVDGVPGPWERVDRFVLNQDRGGGVQGPQRADLYFGTGPLAGLRAGEMRERGEVFFLAPKKK